MQKNFRKESEAKQRAEILNKIMLVSVHS